MPTTSIVDFWLLGWSLPYVFTPSIAEPLPDLTLATTSETALNLTANSEADALGVETDDRGFDWGIDYIETMLCVHNICNALEPALDTPEILFA